MGDFFREGGWSMPVVLLVGLAALLGAVLLALAPDPRKLAFFRAMSTATLFLALSGLAVNLSTVGHTLATMTEGDLGRILLQGVAESVAPLVLGFSVLGVAWVVAAVGLRRAQGALD